MIVFINGKKIEIFKGATIADAVICYSKRSYAMLVNGKLEIKDKYGNITEPDGPMREGQAFRLLRPQVR